MKVTLITARLRFDTAGGVTGTEDRDPETNRSVLPIRTDPKGTPTLPGTTIAGSLRAHCAAINVELGALFGDSPEELADKHNRAERDDVDPERATPSTIQVLGTVLQQGGDIVSHSRNTADRHRGASRTHHIHRVDMLQAGTAFDVMLRWDNPDPTLLHQHFLPALQQWHPALGRGVTRGAGHCSLVGWGTSDYDLGHPDGLLAWLRDTGLESYPQPSEKPPEPERHYVLDADLSIVDGIHCGTEQPAPVDGERNNHIQVLRHGTEFVVPGSTLKGILRSRSEYICRVLGLAACPDQRCGNCRPCLLFGFSNDETAQRSRIIVDDATMCGAESEYRPHVAINRFTGGARDQALYERELVTAGKIPLRIRWLVAPPHTFPDTNGSATTTSEAEQDTRMLDAVLGDLHDGYLGIGSRSTAGNGTVRVETRRSPRFERSELADVLRNPVVASTEKEHD